MENKNINDVFKKLKNDGFEENALENTENLNAEYRKKIGKFKRGYWYANPNNYNIKMFEPIHFFGKLKYILLYSKDRNGFFIIAIFRF